MLAKGRRPILLDSSSQPLLPPSAEDSLLTVFYTSKWTAAQPHETLSAVGDEDPPPCHSPYSEVVPPHPSSAYGSTSPYPSYKAPVQDHLTSMDPFPASESAVDGPTESTSGPASALPPQQRAKWGSIEKRSLEDCLASLSEFDAHHLGRVSCFDRAGKMTAAELMLPHPHPSPSL